MYEQNLKDELFACHNYIKIPFDVLNKMPIRDRKYYIHKYNEYMEAKNAALENKSSKSSSNISSFTSRSQGVVGDEDFEGLL
jgi:hypothetical protein